MEAAERDCGIAEEKSQAGIYDAAVSNMRVSHTQIEKAGWRTHSRYS